MLARLYELLRPPLFAIDPEVSHRLAIQALRAPMPVANVPAPDPRLARKLMGLDFPNPVGLAGGFDKNAEAVDGLFRLGFGFVEIGTLTPRPQTGNDKPRLFRLTEDAALVNRLGFNNQGFEAAHRRLAARTTGGIVGVNIGVNRDSTDRIADYVAGIAAFADVAGYFVVNISSPNTVGLRDLQAREQLRDLLKHTLAARDAAARRVPLLVKLAPDLSDGELAGVAEALVEAGVDGAIATNTTTSRPEVTDQRWAGEKGGLSGRPLFRLSTIRLARLRKLVGTDMPIIGVGGVESGETAWAKFAAGADLVQLYTGMIYKGPGLPAAINRYLARRLAREGHASIADIVGKRTAEWAAEEI
jgi:dihydroorotate dehydrogenase